MKSDGFSSQLEVVKEILYALLAMTLLDGDRIIKHFPCFVALIAFSQ
jgi:hypothetical protein